MRGAFRKAIAASLGVHAVAAIALVVGFRGAAGRPGPSRPVLDTRVRIQLGFPAEEENREPVPTTALPEEPPPSSEAPPPEAVSSEPSASESRTDSRLQPASAPVFHPTTDLLGMVKRAAYSRPVQPAAASTKSAAPQPAWAAGGTAVHGPLEDRQAIVYVLDASGSMGEWGKFDAARAALIASLRLQPPSVRFQIVAYAGSARIVLRGAPGECLPATPGNIARTIAALESLAEPAGRSSHVEGLRTALALHPDLVLFFTDADDLPAAALRTLRKQADRPATLCVARIHPERIETPIELK